MAINLSLRPTDAETGALIARRTPGAGRPGERGSGLARGAGEKAPPSGGQAEWPPEGVVRAGAV